MVTLTPEQEAELQARLEAVRAGDEHAAQNAGDEIAAEFKLQAREKLQSQVTEEELASVDRTYTGKDFVPLAKGSLDFDDSDIAGALDERKMTAQGEDRTALDGAISDADLDDVFGGLDALEVPSEPAQAAAPTPEAEQAADAFRKKLESLSDYQPGIGEDLAAIDLTGLRFESESFITLEQQLAQLPEARLTQDILDGKTTDLDIGSVEATTADIVAGEAVEQARSRPSHSRPSNPNPGRGGR